MKKLLLAAAFCGLTLTGSGYSNDLLFNNDSLDDAIVVTYRVCTPAGYPYQQAMCKDPQNTPQIEGKFYFDFSHILDGSNNYISVDDVTVIFPDNLHYTVAFQQVKNGGLYTESLYTIHQTVDMEVTPFGAQQQVYVGYVGSGTLVQPVNK